MYFIKISCHGTIIGTELKNSDGFYVNSLRTTGLVHNII